MSKCNHYKGHICGLDDLNKIRYVIDFCVTKGVANHLVIAESCLDLSSDHSPIIITLSNQFESTASMPFLHNRKTDWCQLRNLVESGINVNIRLHSSDDTKSAVNSTPKMTINSNKTSKEV